MVLETSLGVREVGLTGIVEQCYEQIGIVESCRIKAIQIGTYIGRDYCSEPGSLAIILVAV